MSAKTKRGYLITLKALMGALLGIVLLVVFFKIIANLVNPEGKAKEGETLTSLAEALQRIHDQEPPLYTEQHTIELNPGSALFVMNPVTQQQNGRFGDGNLHQVYDHTYLFSQNRLRILQQGTAPPTYQATQSYKQSHFMRPQACTPANVCLCVCTDVGRKDLTPTNQFDIADPSTNYNLYDGWFPQNVQVTNFLYNVDADGHEEYTCKHLLCEQVKNNAQLVSPLSFNYYQSSTSTLRDLVFFENGFAVARDKKTAGPIGINPLGLEQMSTATKTFVLTLGKDIGGELYACLDVDCVDDINNAALMTHRTTSLDRAKRCEEYCQYYGSHELGQHNNAGWAYSGSGLDDCVCLSSSGDPSPAQVTFTMQDVEQWEQRCVDFCEANTMTFYAVTKDYCTCFHQSTPTQTPNVNLPSNPPSLPAGWGLYPYTHDEVKQALGIP
ncbi:hypothetical protein JXA12_02500 [Candidatus Woesearchaeota archaeon]|nr:hypothetical protein [Candidatus Woesearchaeota archaeon]